MSPAYRYTLVFDYDGEEVRKSYYALATAQQEYTAFVINAPTDPKAFSVSLLDLEHDKRIAHWERHQH